MLDGGTRAGEKGDTRAGEKGEESDVGHGHSSEKKLVIRHFPPMGIHTHGIYQTKLSFGNGQARNLKFGCGLRRDILNIEVC
jgi:hypothetical protein